jgi:hypothetical protein
MSFPRTFAYARVTTLPVVALLVVAWSAPHAFAQDVDAMAKWTAATVIHYSVVGEFSGETRILSFEKSFPVSDSTQVTDRVEVEGCPPRRSKVRSSMAGQKLSIHTRSNDYFDTIAVLLVPDGTPVTGGDD